MEPPQAGSIAIGLAAVLGLVLANAFFVAAEFALVGARRTRLQEMARAGDRKARRADRVIQSLERYISATQLGITVAGLGLGWIGEPALARLILRGFAWLPPALGPIQTATLASIVAFVLITYTLIIVGELIPKALALRYPELLASWFAGPLLVFAWAMAAPIRVLNGTAGVLLRSMGIRSAATQERLHSPEEIRMLVEQSQEGGQLHKEDARLIEGVFEFSEKNAEDVMTPRTDIVALDASLTVEQAADVVAAAQRSRYPVHVDSLDDIVGVAHAKDILRTLRTSPGTLMRSIARPPLLVPGTREVEDVLADMKRVKSHMAIVLDEYGGTAGLVTMEDLLEEIVGPIFDEYDAVERQDASGGAPVVDGGTAITDFNQDHGGSLDDSEYTTVGGYVFGQLGRLPRVGDRVPGGGFTLEVAAMDGRRVRQVRLLNPDAGAPGPGAPPPGS
jgi:CBS domain containing-hemolysin-like protein